MTAEFWEYDSRLGRRFNTDPVVYPWQSTYACFNNNPIYFIDPSGLEPTNDDKNSPKGTGTKDDPIYTKGNITEGTQQLDEIVISPKPSVQSPSNSTAGTYNVTPQNSTGNSPNKRSDVSRDLANAFHAIGVNLRRFDNYFDKYQNKMPEEYSKPLETSNGGYMQWGYDPNRNIHMVSDNNDVEMTDGYNPGSIALELQKKDVFEKYLSKFIHGNFNKAQAWQKIAESMEKVYKEYDEHHKYEPTLQAPNADTIYMRMKNQPWGTYRYIVKDANGDSIGGAYYTGPDPTPNK